MRTWLLNRFYPSAFTHEDQDAIFCLEHSDETYVSLFRVCFWSATITEDMSDPVFLLCSVDIKEVFPSEDPMFCPGANADLTPWVKKLIDRDPNVSAVCWWLRSSSPSSPIAHIISPAESIGASQIKPDNNQGVRPAMWVKLRK